MPSTFCKTYLTAKKESAVLGSGLLFFILRSGREALSYSPSLALMSRRAAAQRAAASAIVRACAE